MSPVPIQTAAGPEPRAASSAWRLPWRRRTAILHVFISSPGDCAGERRALRRAILTVSNGEPARSRGILLQPLMWEDLPPGQATPGDLQSGIDALLVRYGLEEYEIYLGLMKTRIGTPTPRSRSGTVEEFETALERRRKTRQPAEILFYFLDGEAPQEAVTTFRDELGNRGFLYRSAASGEALEAAVHVHLARIVEEWFHWRNRLRRQVRHWRGVVLLTGALLILGASLFYMRFDRGAAVRIRATLALQGPPAASVVYARLSPYMWIHGPSVRRDINGAFLANVKGAQSIAVSLGHFEEWTVSAARLPDSVGQGRRWLAPRLERGMEQLGIDLATTQELELWTRAGDCGLWDIDSPVSRRLLTSIATGVTCRSGSPARPGRSRSRGYGSSPAGFCRGRPTSRTGARFATGSNSSPSPATGSVWKRRRRERYSGPTRNSRSPRSLPSFAWRPRIESPRGSAANLARVSSRSCWHRLSTPPRRDRTLLPCSASWSSMPRAACRRGPTRRTISLLPCSRGR